MFSMFKLSKFDFLLDAIEISLTDRYKIFRGKSQSIENANFKDNYLKIINGICEILILKTRKQS